MWDVPVFIHKMYFWLISYHKGLLQSDLCQMPFLTQSQRVYVCPAGIEPASFHLPSKSVNTRLENYFLHNNGTWAKSGLLPQRSFASGIHCMRENTLLSKILSLKCKYYIKGTIGVRVLCFFSFTGCLYLMSYSYLQATWTYCMHFLLLTKWIVFLDSKVAHQIIIYEQVLCFIILLLKLGDRRGNGYFSSYYFGDTFLNELYKNNLLRFMVDALLMLYWNRNLANVTTLIFNPTNIKRHKSLANMTRWFCLCKNKSQNPNFSWMFS